MDIHPVMLTNRRTGCGCGGCLVALGKWTIIFLIACTVIAVLFA
jgi:hypothetical protein